MSLPLRITLRLILTIVLVWAMQIYLPQYVLVTGGLTAWIIIGILLTGMNLIVRPILQILALPVHLLATLLSFILVNIVFTWLTVWIIGKMDQGLAMFEILGIAGWVVVPIVLGVANGVMKMLLSSSGSSSKND